MSVVVRGILLFLAVGMLSVPVRAEEVTKEQLKSLDEQLQEIKTDTLKTGANLLLLEEKLLYPSSTQVAVYVSLDNAATYRLEAITMELDGKEAAQYLYGGREFEALQKGGIQRLYAGNITTGEHGLAVAMRGKARDGSNFSTTEQFKFTKDVGPKMLEVRLVESGDHKITLRNW